MRPIAGVWCAVLALTPVGAQDAAPAPPPEADLETIRDWAAARLNARAAHFEDLLKRSLAMLNSTLADDAPPVADTITRLAKGAAPHAAMVAAYMKEHASPMLRRRLAEVLTRTREPSIGGVLVDEAQRIEDAEVVSLLLRAVGEIGAVDVAPQLVEWLGRPPSEALKGEIVLTLARLEAKEALPAARLLLQSADAKARERAVRALGLVGAGRDDIDTLRRFATGDDVNMKLAALAALGRFKGDLDALRTLHDAVVTSDESVVASALSGLEHGGTKELSPPYLLQVVKNGPTQVLKERAARILMRFGNADGVRIIVQPEKAEADRSPKELRALTKAGDRCRELGWYEGALGYYERALQTRAGANSPDVLISIARCSARLKRFEDAKRRLRAAQYTSFSPFADDPDFAEMRELPAYRDAFK